MARNAVLASTPEMHRSLPVPEGTKSGDPVIVGKQIGVAITDRAVAFDPENPDPQPANGNQPGYATVARDGQWRLTVTGAVTAVGTPVYIAAAGTLSVTAGSDTLFGYAQATKPADPGAIPVELALV
jgi:predicted RecA/RadA family phage recombinase